MNSKFVFLALFIVTFIAYAEMPLFSDGVRIQDSDGGDLFIEDPGYASPCYVDWDGDGKKDLIVGQFLKAHIRLYLNTGTNAKPQFSEFEYMKSDGEVINLNSG